jgi:preprotein translocase subunit SecA
MVSRAIRSAQTQVEQQNFEIRKNVLKYDEVLNRQRTVIYDERRKVLAGRRPARPDPQHARRRHRGLRLRRDLRGLPGGLGPRAALDRPEDDLPVSIPLAELDEDRSGLSTESLTEDLQADAQSAYDAREASLGTAPDGEPVMRELERRVLLSVMDRKWREHLYEMDYLQEGIGLRAMGQRDPLVEYQREGYDMFNAMMDAIKEESVGFIFNLEVRSRSRWTTARVTTRSRSMTTWTARCGSSRRRTRRPPTSVPRAWRRRRRSS